MFEDEAEDDEDELMRTKKRPFDQLDAVPASEETSRLSKRHISEDYGGSEPAVGQVDE
jgi:hypothetical protein